MKNFMLAHQVDPPVTKRAWRIIEVYASIDGPRTRITSHVFDTEEEAMFVLLRLREKEK